MVSLVHERRKYIVVVGIVQVVVPLVNRFVGLLELNYPPILRSSFLRQPSDEPSLLLYDLIEVGNSLICQLEALIRQLQSTSEIQDLVAGLEWRLRRHEELCSSWCPSWRAVRRGSEGSSLSCNDLMSIVVSG
jgi:hypothetical protein